MLVRIGLTYTELSGVNRYHEKATNKVRNNHPVHRDCEIACGQKLALRHREGVDNSSNLRSYTPTQKKHIKENDVK